MNILLIGADGQLGTDIMKVFSFTPKADPRLTENLVGQVPLAQGGKKGLHPTSPSYALQSATHSTSPIAIKGLTIQKLDITDFSNTKHIIKEANPAVIINTAAYHNVPECEKNPEKSFLVNTIAVRNLALICRTLNIKLIHLSTDYVFDGLSPDGGKKKSPYTEEDVPNPLNVYAVSKLAGEFFVKQIMAPRPKGRGSPKAANYYIIRVASLFGTAGCLGKGGTNFVETMLSPALARRGWVEVTSNITCSPTYTYDAALKIKEMLLSNYPSGLYHLTNSGCCTWYEFASEIFKLSNIKYQQYESSLNTNILNTKILHLLPKEEQEEQAGVRRPLFSPLTSKKLTPLRPWQDALKHYLANRKINH